MVSLACSAVLTDHGRSPCRTRVALDDWLWRI